MSDPPDKPTFTLFSNLPTELRLQIWRLSCTPRVVTVSWDIRTQNYAVHFTTNPAILQVNSESRAEALGKVYSCFFTTHPVFFAPALDTLYIARNRYMGYADPVRNAAHNLKFAPDIVRSLAVDHVSPTERKEWETYSKWCLFKSFPQLDEAYLVLGGLERDNYLETEKEREGMGQHQTIEFVEPHALSVSANKELDDFVESWIYDLADEPGLDKTVEFDERVEENKFLTTILRARRGNQWKRLWKCREAHVTAYGSEAEWWSTERRSELGWVDVPDYTKYRTRNGVRYYRRASQD
ncbi:hypothetical protein CONLIGDRAFT_379424 [Coniochaeta ligniaria NRRL 30616]|uniref:2EXR domain-containing protein n=1 Tax=Coniochaeta ligniaria NRRL 30616 TaxID=1408157 RepID=A0A1J7IM96_9PEZI|nr:hypothetical protein CONLIGDRAFT_379424 [Coniochaeta ligniaria NRRL 30616]